jgi:hypothetical protein
MPTPVLAAEQALTIAQADAVKAYRDVSIYCIRLALEKDGWHVDYELKDPKFKGEDPIMSLTHSREAFSPGGMSNDRDRRNPRTGCG